MALAPQRTAISIEQTEIRIVLTKKPGIEYQIVSGSFLPLANIERLRKALLLVVMHREAIALGVDLDGDQWRDVGALRMRVPD